jgi:hypothetical protein
MPIAYNDAHPGETADMTDPEEKEIVVNEWIAQYAELYRNFTNTHADETIDLNNEKSVQRLWERIKLETVS